MKKEGLTVNEKNMLRVFAKKNHIILQKHTNDTILNHFYIENPGKDSLQEQMFGWLRLRPEEDDIYLKTAKDIVAEYGEEFLKSANIIEVGSGQLPNLSERLLELVPGISRITVYDPNLITKIFDWKEERKNRIRKLQLKGEEFTTETPIDTKRPTLIIARHPCGGTPAIIDVAGQKKSVELYAVLCNCNDYQMKEENSFYYSERARKDPSGSYPKIRILDPNTQGYGFEWHNYTLFSLKRYRPEVIAKKLSQYGNREDDVILTNPTRSK